MKTLVLTVVVTLAIASTSLAQEQECGTVLTEHDLAVMLRQAAAGAYELGGGPRAIVYVPLTFHVVRTNEGTGGLPVDRICQALDDLDTGYLAAEIQFYLGGPVDYIDDDHFYYDIDTMDEINSLRSTNPVPDTINVYFTENLAYEGGGLCGLSSFTSSPVQGIVMANGCTALPTNHSTFPHEVGHYFDLYHTHETYFGEECVDGSNCDVAGDLLCDTPADPDLSGEVDEDCEYTGAATDSCNSDPYSPDPTNLMSYSRKLCRDNFTAGQDTRALATLTNLRPELVHASLPGPADCNGNGIRDDCDIASGTSADFNGNGVPDECEMFAPAVYYAAGDGPHSVAIGDLDGDQVPDLVVANMEGYNVSVLLGLGDGTFAGAVNYAASGMPISVAIGDLDGDQVPDLAVANHADENVSVLLGLGDGTFATPMHYDAGSGPNSVAIGDLDGDQVPDLAVTNQVDNNVSVLSGIGDGTFADAVNYDAGASPTSVAIGDLNADQAPDLAVANASSHNVSVLLGGGDGTFAAQVQYAGGLGPVCVAVGDLDGDQVPDLAVANEGSDNVSVLLGVCDGTFAAAVHYGAGEQPRSVAIGDLDADQVPDLAVANRFSDDVSVLLGVGDGTFAAAAHYGAGNEPWSVSIADVDGNEAPDLAVANRFSDNVSVLLNQSPTPGDLDGDGDVDLTDLAELLSSYGTCAGDEDYNADADIDGDGCVDLSDLAALLSNYGAGA